MLKILQARIQQYMNHEFQMFKLDLEKAEEPEIKIPTSIKKVSDHTIMVIWVMKIFFL